MAKTEAPADLPPCGGDVRQDRGGREGTRPSCLSNEQKFPAVSALDGGEVGGTAPPSALPGISPTRGEISGFGVAPYSSKSISSVWPPLQV
ncbi:hypothetical protein FJ987_30615 [Mesorhizobium sp. CU2]|nr:hypothetical protein FJ988_29570 [Mesorhizobium sp. CU3]TPO01085.1 hypothetical protein FJ987_30615 [Mesorhizobium sp. CU2]